ncbi:hypothetical protein [Sediminicola arcticus]|jgi:xanthine/uracil permease
MKLQGFKIQMDTYLRGQNTSKVKRLPLLLILGMFFVVIPTLKGQLIQEDKMLHFGVGAVIGAGTTGVVYGITKNKTKAVIWGIGLSTLAGITKEVIDHNRYGKADTGDMVATTLGGIFGSFSVKIVLDKKRKRRRRLK